MEVKEVKIGSNLFTIKRLNARKALKLDKLLVDRIAEVAGGINFEAGLEQDVSVMIGLLGKAWKNWDVDSFMNFIDELFSCLQVKPDGKPYQEFTEYGLEKLDITPIEIYKVAIEVMKFNKFSPFELVGGGGLINIMGGLSEENLNKKKSTKT